jgi:hypothetical protein
VLVAFYSILPTCGYSRTCGARPTSSNYQGYIYRPPLLGDTQFRRLPLRQPRNTFEFRLTVANSVTPSLVLYLYHTFHLFIFTYITLVISLTPCLVIILLISRSTFYSLFPIPPSPNSPALNTTLPSMDPIFSF